MPARVYYNSKGKAAIVLVPADEFQDGQTIASKCAKLRRVIERQRAEIRDLKYKIKKLHNEVEDLSEKCNLEMTAKKALIDNGIIAIRYYKKASGYYIDAKRFRVLKGSVVRKYPCSSFMTRFGDIWNELLADGVLKQNANGEIEFTESYTFNSSSDAASVVSGNPRSGPEAWGKY